MDDTNVALPLSPAAIAAPPTVALPLPVLRLSRWFAMLQAFLVCGIPTQLMVAVVLVLFTPDLASHRAWVFIWNVVGFLDIGYAVLTATRLALADPQSIISLLRLPLSIVPTFLVPIIIASHVLIFSRLMKE